MNHDPIVIVAARRTPMGGLLGDLSSLTAPQLGSAAIRALLEDTGIAPERVDQVLMGCVLPAGLGQAPARQAALGAGLPVSCASTTINKMCGSGMQAAILAHDQLLAGSARVMIAGGMESMSNAPYLLEKARAGYRMGHGKVLDHMFLDGLEDAYDKGRLMGTFAEDCASADDLGRTLQDDFARESLRRANAAIDSGAFAAEVVSLSVRQGKQQVLVAHDEQPPKARPEKIGELRPAFREGGTVTAANSSSISDGAAALLLMRQSQAQTLGLKPLAAIRGHATHATEPGQFPIAPVGAVERLLERCQWQTSDVDLYEINEAFAVVTLACASRLGLDLAKVNVNGGACALGHPIGASGARILVTLLHALRARQLRRGVAAICIGGGEATAMALEIL